MSQVLGPLKIYTEDINSMIDDLSSAGVKTSAIAIAASVFITYFVEMYQKTSAEVSQYTVHVHGRQNIQYCTAVVRNLLCVKVAMCFEGDLIMHSNMQNIHSYAQLELPRIRRIRIRIRICSLPGSKIRDPDP